MAPTHRLNDPDRLPVGPDTAVRFGYSLLDADGEVVESSGADESLAFVYGYGELAPALEDALLGARVGEERRVDLEPEAAFGERVAGATIEVERAEFPPDVQVGDEFEAEDAGGEIVPLKVLEVTPEAVLLDLNHPLAGQNITLLLRVISVRPATVEEINDGVSRLIAREASAASPLIPVSTLLRTPRARAPLENPQ